LGAFLTGLAFLGDLAAFFVTWPPFGATWAFLLAFGFTMLAAFGSVAVSAINSVILISPLAVITVTTWITLVRAESKRILRRIGQRRWKGDPSELGPDDRR
jgi:hypothetical protein